MKMVHGSLLMVAVTLLLAQGCSSSGDTVSDDVEETPVEESSSDASAIPEEDAEIGAASLDGGTFEGRPINEVLNDAESVLSQRIFYFDFNSSELSTSDQDALASHAQLLNATPELLVVLEGHADERGSREYNLALSERRAKSIERLLSLHGVDRVQLQVISFGEERPAASGHDEESWRLNRRVELLYSGY